MSLKGFISLVFVMAFADPASAQNSNNAERLATEIRSILPGAVVAVPDPNGLEITFEGQTRPLGIGSVNEACVQGAASCDAMIHQYAQRAASYMLETVPLKRDQLRIVVRSRSYLSSVSAKTSSSSEFILEPLAGDLVSICFRDLPNGRSPITAEDLPTLKLDRQAALSICKNNSRRALAPLAPQWKALPQNTVGYIQTGDDATGYLSAPQDWRALAKQLGSLIVAVPSIDMVLYARGSTAIDLDALGTLAEQMRSQASVPVSAQVLRWTDRGWVPVAAK